MGKRSKRNLETCWTEFRHGWLRKGVTLTRRDRDMYSSGFETGQKEEKRNPTFMSETVDQRIYRLVTDFATTSDTSRNLSTCLHQAISETEKIEKAKYDKRAEALIGRALKLYKELVDVANKKAPGDKIELDEEKIKEELLGLDI